MICLLAWQLVPSIGFSGFPHSDWYYTGKWKKHSFSKTDDLFLSVETEHRAVQSASQQNRITAQTTGHCLVGGLRGGVFWYIWSYLSLCSVLIAGDLVHLFAFPPDSLVFSKQMISALQVSSSQCQRAAGRRMFSPFVSSQNAARQYGILAGK